MSELADLKQRLERLEARNEISELISAYAVACDEHDMPRLTDQFTQDAVFTSPSGVMEATGRKDIAAMFVELFKVRGPGYHWTHDHFIKVDPGNGDRATGLVLSHAETSPDGTVSLAAMRYEDEYHRKGGTWRFAKRSISFLYYVPAADFSTALNGEMRLQAGGQLYAADYPENLPAWQDFDRRHK